MLHGDNKKDLIVIDLRGEELERYFRIFERRKVSVKRKFW